jgi:hypothetical protein
MTDYFLYQYSASCCVYNWGYYKYRLRNTFYVLSFIRKCSFYCCYYYYYSVQYNLISRMNTDMNYMNYNILKQYCKKK